MKIAVGISGASGSILGLKLLCEISKAHEVFAVISSSAKTASLLESQSDIDGIINFCIKNGSKSDHFLNLKDKSCQIPLYLNDINYKNITFFDNQNISASIASGSFGIDKTIITPCSINTLAKISNGISDTLLTRAAAVALKERKPLILGIREMPLSTISLRQMAELSALGVVIAPPIVGLYSSDKSIDDIYNFIVGKWLDLLGIENKIYKRWQN